MKYALALFTSLAFVSTANAGAIVADVAPTDGLPGFQTVVLSYQAEAGESFRGIDATFTGALNQVQAAGMDTPFGNLNAFIPAEALRDSQFLFLGTETGLLSIGVEEDPNRLAGAISGLADLDPALPNPSPFVRLVIAEGSTLLGADVQVDIALDNGGTQAFTYEGPLSGLIIPEPTTLALAGLAMVGFATRRRRS